MRRRRNFRFRPDTGEFAMVLTNGAFIAVFRGNFERAGELTERALEMARRVGYAPGVATALNVRGLMRRDLADRGEGRLDHASAGGAARW